MKVDKLRRSVRGQEVNGESNVGRGEAQGKLGGLTDERAEGQSQRERERGRECVCECDDDDDDDDDW